MTNPAVWNVVWPLIIFWAGALAISALIYRAYKIKPKAAPSAPATAAAAPVPADLYFDEMRDEDEHFGDAVLFHPLGGLGTYWVEGPCLFNAHSGSVLNPRELREAEDLRLITWMARYRAACDQTDPVRPLYFADRVDADDFRHEHKLIVKDLHDYFDDPSQVSVKSLDIRIGIRPEQPPADTPVKGLYDLRDDHNQTSGRLLFGPRDLKTTSMFYSSSKAQSIDHAIFSRDFNERLSGWYATYRAHSRFDGRSHKLYFDTQPEADQFLAEQRAIVKEMQSYVDNPAELAAKTLRIQIGNPPEGFSKEPGGNLQSLVDEINKM